MDGSASAAARGRILLVDDDRMFGIWAAKVLEPRGLEVHHMLDPVKALSLIETESWDLLITDIEMPRMTGLEFLKRARHLVPGLPAAVITAYPSMDRAVAAVLQPDTQFIQKPVPSDVFAARVEEMIATRRPDSIPHPESVLAVGAHPGDVEIGAAGALLAHQAAGVPVAILTLGPGAPAEPGAAGAQAPLRATRLALDFPWDGQPGGAEEATRAIASVIARTWPSVIYTHSIHDARPDHREAHLAVVAAARRIEVIYGFQSSSAALEFQPARLVAIDDQLDGKLAAVGAFAAEPEVRSCLGSDLIRSTARYWGRYCDGQHAEAFEVVRDREQAEEEPGGHKMARLR